MKGTGVSVSQSGESAGARMEPELITYRKKMENMAVLIKHYQTELESQKVRRDGVETVSRLLAESRQENLVLKKNQVALETMVKNLQNRLTVNGLSSGSATEDNEVIVPGTSKQTLTNLALENKRLRSMLQKDSTSESINSLQKSAEESETEQSLQNTIDQLTAENKSMKMKLSDLESLFKSSNNEKDRQLGQYQDEIQRLQQRTGESSESGTGVAGLPVLKEQLRAFMAQCQDFEKQLDTVQLQEVPAVREKTAVELEPVTKQAVERADSVDGVDVKQLLEEKQKLQDTVEEVTKMNQRWQEFFNNREKYTQSLEQKVQELDERLKEAMRSGPTHEINRRIELMLEKSQKDIAQVEELRKRAEEDAERLQHDVDVRDAQIGQLQSQVTILSRTPQHQSPVEVSSTIEHLKAQIQVCTEDFEKERQDRQVALQKVASLQEQVKRLQDQNGGLQNLNTHLQTVMRTQVGQTPRPAAQEHAQYGLQDPHTLQPRGGRYGQSNLDYDSPKSPHSNENWRDFPDFDYEAPHKEHAFPAPGPLSMPGTTMELIARGSKPKHSLSDSALGSEASKQENFLTCPKCNKEFSEEQQGELLAHMDVCWE